MGLGAGLPQVCIPQHLEQLHVARRLAETGAARVISPRHAPAEAIIATLHAAWQDQAMARRARELATELAPVLAQDDGPLLRARLMPWLGA
jgi:UDP:flavonoid glycosyltransferase YjiC (YdhE family)